MNWMISVCLTLLICAGAIAETLNVAAAISLKDSLVKIAEQYKRESGDEIHFNFGSSGTLAAQIQNGAPIDLFISAAMKQINDLSQAGKCNAEMAAIVAGNSLVLLVPASTGDAPDSLNALADSKFAKIAVGEPKSVPAGMYAQQALKKTGVYERIKEKLVLGTNVRQVLDYVERGEVSAGLVYATDAKISGDKAKVAATINSSTHDPIIYPAIILTGTPHADAASRFLSYLKTEKGQAIFKAFGFSGPPPANSAQK